MSADPTVLPGEETDEPLNPEGGGTGTETAETGETVVDTAPVNVDPKDLYALVEAEFGDQVITDAIPNVTDRFTADDLKAMSPTERVAMRVVLGRVRAKEAEVAAKAAALEAPIKEREAALEAAKAQHLREVAKYRAMASSPRIRELLAKPADGSDLDPFTPEGQRELAARNHAQGMRPFVEDAARAEREAALTDFISANTWAQSKAPGDVGDLVQKRALALITERNKGLTAAELAAGKGLDPREALKLVHADDLIADTQKRRNAALRASQESAKRIARATSPSTPSAPTVPPGLRGERLAEFFRSHPDAHRRYRQENGLA